MISNDYPVLHDDGRHAACCESASTLTRGTVGVWKQTIINEDTPYWLDEPLGDVIQFPSDNGGIELA
jgi:uncharacterized protein YfaQ (DUF2300 family)